MAVKYFTFKNQNSTDYGILEQYPRPPRAAGIGERVANIPGRAEPVYLDADIIAFQTAQIPMNLILHSPEKWRTVYAWLSGRGRLVIGNDPDYYYNAYCDTAIAPEHINRLCGKIPAVFSVKPFRYLCNPETITLTNAATIDNPGSIYSEPIITVAGSGDITLTVNGESITLFDVDESITLDTPRRLAYRGNTVLLNKTSRDFLPMFCVGTNYISWTGNVTSVTIVPEWRWL